MKSWTTGSGYQIIRVLSGRSNVFLLSNGRTNVLVDTSTPRHWKKLIRVLKVLDLKAVDFLVLTHSHYDHAGNARKVQEKHRAKVVIHWSEAQVLAKGEMIVPKGTTAPTRILTDFLGERVARRMAIDPCIADVIIGDVFDMAAWGFNAYLLHTPGHTAGSVSVIIDDELALVGDAMFGMFKGSVFPPYADDVSQLVKSWGKLLQTNCLQFLPSHGGANSRSLVEKSYRNRFQS